MMIFMAMTKLFRKSFSPENKDDIITLFSCLIIEEGFYSETRLSVFFGDQFNENRENNLFQDVEHTRYFCSV